MKWLAVLAVTCAACVEHGERPEVTNIDAGDEPTDPTDALARFSSCMRFEDFVAAGMGQRWRATKANNGSDCIACHSDGQGSDPWPGALDDLKFFGAISQHRKHMLLFFTVDPTNRVIVDERRIPSIAGTLSHPSFDTMLGMTATREFHMATSQLQLAAGGTCGPSKLLD
jgi:hypothetical protein